jgi:transposase
MLAISFNATPLDKAYEQAAFWIVCPLGVCHYVLLARQVSSLLPHGLEYHRHGTLSLYAAFDTNSGEVMGKTAAHHTSQEFVAFLTDLVANQPCGQEIHLIADNLSAHKTMRVEQFLTAHPNVHLHHTPTYSAWLHQVENWLAKVERDGIARGIFISVKDLARKLMRYIRHYNRAPKPIK